MINVKKLSEHSSKEPIIKGITALFDAWFASKENFRIITQLGYYWVTRLKKNRLVIINGITMKITKLKGKNAWKCKDGNNVQVFVTNDEYYFATSNLKASYKKGLKQYKLRWKIEESYRILKQCYNLGSCQARRLTVWSSHIFFSLLAYNNMEISKINHYALRNANRLENLNNKLNA